MDVELTDAQALFRETTERFIASAFPLARVREVSEAGGGIDRAYWRQAAQLGWFSMLAPEDLDGGSVSGNGLVDAAIVAQARGRELQPGPFVETNVVVAALAAAGSAQQRVEVLGPVLKGAATVTWATAGTGAPWARVEEAGGTYLLHGSAAVVPHADGCDWMLVAARGDAGLTQVLVRPDSAGVRVQRCGSLDLTRGFCEVHFDRVRIEHEAVVGRAGEAAELVDQLLQIAGVLVSAESTGTMERDLTEAVQYGRDRIAFGRPIGSFQAVKHLLADTSLALEMSKALVATAATAGGRRAADADALASMAKAFVGDSGIDLAQSCFQVFGGIGFTWEHDQHLYLRRLTTDAFLYGDPAWHRERLCQLAGV